MPRTSRAVSKTGIYHVLLRGVSKIFNSEKDKPEYLDRLAKCKEECGFYLYAYALMEDHVHLLIHDGGKPLSTIIKKLNIGYASWYNTKYERVGSLFQGRYKSEPVESHEYILTVARYILQTPATHTSYNDYLARNKYDKLTDTKIILDAFCSNDYERAKKLFSEYVNEKNDDKCLDIETKLTDTEAKNLIPKDIKNMAKPERDAALKTLKEKGMSIRQIERLTGINRGIILNV
ncbi:MAG: transposase [Defluviitaleaceae bacterium]|nr:transposase [Defluviitaleaceae bacterium]